MYACSWLIYVYTYAINYVDTIRTNSRISREIRTCVCTCVCIVKVSCNHFTLRTLYARHRRLTLSTDWCVELMECMIRMVDRRWRMKYQYLFNFIILHPEGAVRKWRVPVCIVRLFPTLCQNIARIYRTFVCVVWCCARARARVCVCMCVCARMCWCVCISFGWSLTLRLNNAR